MVKMKPGESLKNYITYFQSQMTLVYNCNEDVVVTAFISGLQVTHSFYKHLVKSDVTKMRDILVQTQKTCRLNRRLGLPPVALPNKDPRSRS